MNQVSHKIGFMHSFQFLMEKVRIHKMSILNSGHTNKWAFWTNQKVISCSAGVFLVVCIHHSPTLVTLRLSIFLVFTSCKRVESFPTDRNEILTANKWIQFKETTSVTMFLVQNAVVQYKHFKAFFCVQDPSKIPPNRKECPMYKVDSILKHTQVMSMRTWRLGRDISGDEQTIGFQGKHEDKLRIMYKAEGDGFQCDAICDSGFTWTFYFRNQKAPREWTSKGFSPLHARILRISISLK